MLVQLEMAKRLYWAKCTAIHQVLETLRPFDLDPEGDDQDPNAEVPDEATTERAGGAVRGGAPAHLNGDR
jgi:hypothetical protein